MIFNSRQERFIFYYIPATLFCLIPFFLITGSFLSDLSISLIAVLFVIYCIKNKNFSYFKKKYFYFFIIFWCYLVLNSLINNFNINNFATSLVYSRYGIFIIAVVSLLKFKDNFIKYFFYCILICFTILILDGFLQYFTGENILGWQKTTRISSFFGEEKILGSYLSRIWPIFFGISILIFNQKNNKLFILLIFIFILSEALIFLSGDRSAFFYINLSAIFIILFSQNLLKLRLFTLLASILLLLFISLINPSAKERVFNQTVDQMNLTGSEQDIIYIFSKQHTHLYITAYRMFLDNKILGVGLKNFRNYCGNEKYEESKLSCSTHPHNTYIQILAETGIIGFFFIIIALYYFCKYIIKHIRFKFNASQYFNDFEICILSGIAIYLWPFIPTGSFFTNWLTIIMIINFTFFFWSRETNKINKNKLN